MEIREEGRSAFALVAEAIGISTVNVMVARQEPAVFDTPLKFTVVYTRDIENVPADEIMQQPIYKQELRLDADGILVKFGDEVPLGTGVDFREFMRRSFQ